ncbi:MBL fold metallo-hydrolase [Virgibacillus xinjiangensis]|uniref:MBL fold metallo-hydrolase n=1 Tax=Virgibacillus xinjiangensis TaxID=393090 RepID=A0ABV7CSM6_9BACI
MATEALKVYPVVVPSSFDLQSFNFYLVKTQGVLLLVDAGINSRKCWEELNRVLKENSMSLKEIDKIVLTHSHADHTGLVNRVLAEHKVPVYAHEDAEARVKRDANYLAERIKFFRHLYQEMGCGSRGEQQLKLLERRAVENASLAIVGDIYPLHEGDVLDGLEVVETPGHWPDHIILYHQQEGVLFGGDHLIEHISTNALIEPDLNGNKLPTLVQYEQSLKKCQKYEMDTVYAGHGEMIRNPRGLIEKRLNGIERKAERINNLIHNIGSCTADMIAREYYSKVYDREFPLVMSEIIGHLDRLETSGRIEKRKVNGEWMYQELDTYTG